MRGSLSCTAVAALAMTAAALGGCISTATYGTGESPETAIFSEISGGFGAPKKAPIDYQPRAPLVLPPSNQLREPVASAEVANPAWPDDPSKRGAAGVNPNDQNAADDVTRAEYERLKPLGALARGRPNVQERDADKRQPAMDVIGKRQQNEAFRAAVAEQEGLGNSPHRRYLTQPPTEYRQPAATAPTEFEDIDQKKSGNIFRRWFGRS